jgi:hypothetical protein
MARSNPQSLRRTGVRLEIILSPAEVETLDRLRGTGSRNGTIRRLIVGAEQPADPDMEKKGIAGRRRARMDSVGSSV